jgi:hypothetical protein
MAPLPPLALATLCVLGLLVAAGPAMADPPSPELMGRLAAFGAHFETLRSRASYTVEGRVETLGDDGRADSIKAVKARVVPEGTNMRITVLSYVEDGQNKTEEAQKNALESAKKHKSEQSKKTFRIPLLAEEQPRYVFNVVEVDRIDESRVRVGFVPKERSDDTIEGSAWVDARSGELISAAFKLSKTPMFVSYVHFTVTFEARTALGPAISSILVDSEAGLPLFRKHYRARATLSDYQLGS